MELYSDLIISNKSYQRILDNVGIKVNVPLAYDKHKAKYPYIDFDALMRARDWFRYSGRFGIVGFFRHNIYRLLFPAKYLEIARDCALYEFHIKVAVLEAVIEQRQKYSK